MKTQGRFLLNVSDPSLPSAQANHDYTNYAILGGLAGMHLEWTVHLEWIKENVIGPPRATKTSTQKQLEDMNLIGIYAEAEK